MQPIKTITAVAIVALGLSFCAAMAQSPSAPKFHQWALTPPMGWNSWDCYGARVREADVLANADYMDGELKSHGWNLITIDIQWYEPLAHATEYRRGAVDTTVFATVDSHGAVLYRIQPQK